MLAIRIRNYQLIKFLGSGSFGKVYLTTKDGDPYKYYETKIVDSNIFKSENSKKYFYDELRILRMLNNKNVIHLYDYFEMDNNCYFIMEYCNGQTLAEVLKHYRFKYKRPFPQELIQFFMRQIIEGINYIHSLNIIHRDIKLDNILVNFKDGKLDYSKAEIKIIDFGLSKQLNNPTDLASSFVGNILNMDPIILAKYSKAGGYAKLLGYNQSADIWSLGAICYEMLTGTNVFRAVNEKDLIKKVEQKRYSIPLVYDLSNEIMSFLNSMLQFDPKKRASASQLLLSDFLNKNVNKFTKINTQNTIYEIKDGYIIIDFNDKISFKLDILREYMENLLDDYYKVISYFDMYKLNSRKEDANNKFKLIKNCIEDFKINKNPIIKNKLPPPIKPEYIYGYSIEVRNKKFLDIINKYQNIKHNLQLKETKDIQNKNYEISKIDNSINYFMNSYKDIWTPAPEMNDIQQNNNDIYKIMFQAKKVNKKRDNGKVIFNISMIIGGKILYNEQFILKKDTYEWTRNFASNDWNKENFNMAIEGDPKLKMEPQIINIDNIKTQNTMDFTVDIPMEKDKNCSIKLSLTSIHLSKQNNNQNFNNNNFDENKILVCKTIYKAFPGKNLIIKS